MPKKANKRKSKVKKHPSKSAKQIAINKQNLNNDTKRVLHVGCGPKQDKTKALPAIFHGDDWQEVRLDIDPTVEPDIVADITNLHMIENDSFEAIYSSHNLEHVYNHQVPVVLREFFRILKTGGGVVITLPDIQAIALHIAEGKLEEPLYRAPSGTPITALDMLYGLQSALREGKHYMQHKTAFTAKTLGRKMLNAGFCNIIIERDNAFNLWARGNKLPKNHPRYKDEARITGSYDRAVVRIPDPETKPGNRLDELDTPPKMWKPLNLSQT